MFKPAAAPERAPVAAAPVPAEPVPAAEPVEPVPAAEHVPAAKPVESVPAEPAPVAVSAAAPSAPTAPAVPAKATPASIPPTTERASVPVTPVVQSVIAAPAAPAEEPAPIVDEDAYDGLDDDAMMGLAGLSSEPDTQTVDFFDDPDFATGGNFDPALDGGFDPALQADAQDAAVPVKTPAIPLDAFTPDHWVEVSAQLMKQGLDHHLLKDTEWIGCEEGTVMLKTPHKMLKQLAFVGTVQTLLSDYFQTPLKVVFVQGQTENTALEAERRAIIARQQKAEADAQQDRRVQQFIRTFEGELCHDTVQPL